MWWWKNNIIKRVNNRKRLKWGDYKVKKLYNEEKKE